MKKYTLAFTAILSMCLCACTDTYYEESHYQILNSSGHDLTLRSYESSSATLVDSIQIADGNYWLSPDSYLGEGEFHSIKHYIPGDSLTARFADGHVLVFDYNSGSFKHPLSIYSYERVQISDDLNYQVYTITPEHYERAALVADPASLEDSH